MMQVESSTLLDTFNRSWTLSSQESVQQWVDSLADDEYKQKNLDDGKSKGKLENINPEWRSSLSLPESDDGLALGAEAKTFLGVSDFMPLSPRVSPLLVPSDGASDGFPIAGESEKRPEVQGETLCQTMSRQMPPLPMHPSFDSNDTLPSNITTVSSLLALLENDPEDLLRNLGFSDDNPSIIARVPCRFLQRNSSAQGIDTKQFIENLVEDEKDSVSFFTAEDESVSMILGRFRENSIDLDSDGLSCRSDGVYPGWSSSQQIPIPDIRVEEVESLPGSFPWLKKLDTLMEENENVTSPRGSFCSDDGRPPLIRQANVIVSFPDRDSSVNPDEVFVDGSSPTGEIDSPDFERINYFDDDKRVTVKRDSSLMIEFSNGSVESLDNGEQMCKVSVDSCDLPLIHGTRVVTQISDASTIVASSDPSTGNTDAVPLGGIYQTSEELVNDVICGVPSDNDDDDEDQHFDHLESSLPLEDKAEEARSMFSNESPRNFVSSPNSAFDRCLKVSDHGNMDDVEAGFRKSPIPMYDRQPCPAPGPVVPDSSGYISPHDHGLLTAYLEPTSTKAGERHSMLLHAKRRASFAAKTCSIESSGFEDDADPIRLSPIKDTYRRTSSPSCLSEACPLCGSPQSPGWEASLSPGLAAKLDETDGHALCRSKLSNSTTDNMESSQRRHSQYMRDQFSRLRQELQHQESVNEMRLEERVEQMRCEILSEVSQFVVSQLDSLRETLQSKDAEILRLRKQLYEDVTASR